MNSFIIPLILYIAINTLAIGQNKTHKSQNYSTAVTSWKFLSHDKYEIKYPVSWAVDKSGQMGTYSTFFDKKAFHIENIP